MRREQTQPRRPSSAVRLKPLPGPVGGEHETDRQRQGKEEEVKGRAGRRGRIRNGRTRRWKEKERKKRKEVRRKEREQEEGRKGRQGEGRRRTRVCISSETL